MLRHLAPAALASGATMATVYGVALFIAAKGNLSHGGDGLLWLSSWPCLWISSGLLVALCATRWAPDSRGWQNVRWLLLPFTLVVAAAFTHSLVTIGTRFDLVHQVNPEAQLYFLISALSAAVPGLVAPRCGRTIAVLNAVIMTIIAWPVFSRFTDSGRERTILPMCGLLAGVATGATVALIVVRPRDRAD